MLLCITVRLLKALGFVRLAKACRLFPCNITKTGIYEPIAYKDQNSQGYSEIWSTKSSILLIVPLYACMTIKVGVLTVF